MNEDFVPVSKILLAGFSCRAAAWSAHRAGLIPVIYDDCQDLDLPENAQIAGTAEQVNVDQHSTIPLLPTGGWENRLNSWERIEQKRPVWGASSDTIRRVRKPLELTAALIEADFPVLPVRDQNQCLGQEMRSGSGQTVRYVRKSRLSIGGLQTRFPDHDPFKKDGTEYEQQYLPGRTYSIQFFTSPVDRRLTQMLGVTRQLSSVPELPDKSFLYNGNIGPVNPDVDEFWTTELDDQSMVLGRYLAAKFSLEGLWGLDLLLFESDLYVLEVNPRYTSAVEILELTQQQSFLKYFLDPHLVQAPQQFKTQEHNVIGKAIVYATGKCRVPGEQSWRESLKQMDCNYSAWQCPVLSDVPQAGTLFQAGEPICTVWASADRVSNCERQLQLAKQSLRDHLIHRWNL